MKRGTTMNERQLATDVRTLALKEVKAILEDKEAKKYSKTYREAVVLKLTGTILPRKNEHSGEDGKAININFNEVFKSPQQTEDNSTEPEKV